MFFIYTYNMKVKYKIKNLIYSYRDIKLKLIFLHNIDALGHLFQYYIYKEIIYFHGLIIIVEYISVN